MDLMLMLSLEETLDWLVMTNSVSCYGHVMRGDSGVF